MEENRLSAGRIHFMDEVRGFDILLMIAFHAFYAFGWLMEWTFWQNMFFFFRPVQPLFAGLFIFICGICCRLSHSNWKRGGLLAAVSVGVSLVMWLVMVLWFNMKHQMIWFGILHMLAVGILLFALLRPLLDRIPPWLGVLLSVLLIVLTWTVPYNYFYAQFGGFFGVPGGPSVTLPDAVTHNAWLYPLGLGSRAFPSADYFPLLPWVFVFFAGCYVGVWAKAGRFPRWMYHSRAPFLALLGRHSLIIYILHQPVVLGVCKALVWLVRLITG